MIIGITTSPILTSLLCHLLSKMTSSPASNKTVLVTGINGYIGSHIGLQLLHKGYSVLGTVRTISKAQRLLEGAYKDYTSQLKVVEVPDISAEGAFDESVKGKYLSCKKHLKMMLT
jgi:nucleoside-diphosphate-sugar epimerase